MTVETKTKYQLKAERSVQHFFETGCIGRGLFLSNDIIPKGVGA